MDMEMSFVTMEDVMNAMEGLVKHLWSSVLRIDLGDSPFPRLTYADALARYGSDKPDTRYPFHIRTISVEDKIITEGLDLDTSLLSLDAIIAPFGDQVVTATSDTTAATIVCQRSLDDHVGSTVLGKIRTAIIRELEGKNLAQSYRKSDLKFLWVYDFPLLAKADARENQLTGAPSRDYESMHHPFTAPHPDDLNLLLEGDPLAVRGQHYDLVLNGAEIGGGSMRMHSAQLQEYILKDVIKLPEDYINHFKHLLNALGSGCPPHGGMALGLDRVVALMCGANSIRDVIAFPKNGTGIDLCVGAPN